jgi:hypothetical protein
MAISQKSWEMELANFVQIDERSFTFDVNLRNLNPAAPFGLAGIQWQITFNTGIKNGGEFQNSQLQYVAGSSQLVGVPMIPTTTNFTLIHSGTKFQWGTNSLNLNQLTTYFDDGNWKRIGTFKALLRTAGTGTTVQNFADGLVNMNLVTSGCLVLDCEVYFDSAGDGSENEEALEGPGWYRATPPFTELTTKTVTNSISPTQTISGHYMNTGTNWATAASWNNAVAVGHPAKNQLPTADQNALIGVNAVVSPSTSATIANLTIKSGASLTIQSDATGTGSLIASNSVQATVQRHMTGNTWHQVSGAVVEDIDDFLLSNSNIPTNGAARGMQSFNTATNSWNSFYTNSSPGAISPGQGFMVRTSTDAAVAFAGALNVGNVDVPVNSNSYRWNCLGNPYSSAISLNDLAGSTNFYSVNSTKLDGSYGAIYIWNNNTYSLINRADQTAAYAPVGQGFFVKAANGASGNFSFSSAMQSHQNPVGLKSGKATQPEIKLMAVNNSLKANTNIKFIEGASRGLDVGYDAGILKADPKLAIFTHLVQDNGVEFMLQCLSDKDYKELAIPVGIDCAAGGEMTLSAELMNLPTDLRVILEDKVNHYFADLAKGPYTTTIDANTVASSRFVLHTSTLATGLDDDAFDNQLTAYAFKNIELRIQGKVNSGAIASLFDLQGRLLIQKQLNDSTDQIIKLNGAYNGVYLLQVKDNNKVKSFKLAIQQ